MSMSMGDVNGHSFHDEDGESELLYSEDSTIFNQYITGEQLTLEETRRTIALKAAAHSVSGTAVILTETAIIRMAKAFETYLKGEEDDQR